VYIPSSEALSLLFSPGSLQRGPLISRLNFILTGISSFIPTGLLRTSEGQGISSIFPSETDFEHLQRLYFDIVLRNFQDVKSFL
jgi:hypothetical protein